MKNKIFIYLVICFALIHIGKLFGQNILLNSEIFSETEIQAIIIPEEKTFKIKEIPELQPLSPIEKVFNTKSKIKEFEEGLKSFYETFYESVNIKEKKENIKEKKIDIKLFQDIKKIGIIRQFGYDFFSVAPTTFAPVTEVPVGSDYILGPEDEIIINIWGLIEGNYKLQIDREGCIFIPKIGKISLFRKSFGEAKKEIEKAIRSQYKNFEISISIGKLKTIKVHVAGEVKYPGTYEVSSLSNLTNVLYVSGGPTKNGSLRKIKLLRNNETVCSLDFYRFLLYGDKNNDIRLQSGDIIFVEPIGDVVCVYGNCIKRPGIYEITENTKLEDIIEIAGGTFSFGIKPSIKITFPENGKLKEVFLEEKSFVLKGGESIEISTNILSRKEQKMVTVEGEVKNPGVYVIEDGERLSSLLQRVGGFTENAFLKGAIFKRKSVEESQRENLDIFIKFQEESIIRQIGSIQMGDEQSKFLMQQKEIITTLLTKLPLGRIRIKITPYDILKESKYDLILEDGDSLFIPQFPQSVICIGAVMSPGAIAFVRGEKLESYIKKCGGYSKYADRRSVFVIHADGIAESISTGYKEIQQGDVIIVPAKPLVSGWAFTKDIFQMFYQIALPVAAIIQ